ncbi:MAG: hypothetical protein KME11_05990 [Timaviella obliquedivisa GSE-PSE-MK23-08B]|jgi:hypothetical protein|nr:hypothetical protein [Timaviella obliquedivisa GSE-PSE-MK23-08B]
MRVSTVTLCTLTAIATGDLTQKAIATPAPPVSSTTEDLAALPEALSTDVIITSTAPTESIVVEPFTSAKVPDLVNAVFRVASEPALADQSGVAIAPNAEPSVAEPFIAESTFIPVAELITVNTTPESTSIPERRIESRMPLEAALPAVPESVTELTAQTTPNAPSPVTPTPTELTPVNSDVDPTDSEIEELQRQLNAVPTLQDEFGDEFGSSPAITISNPSGRGADRFTAFLNTSFQSDTRFTDSADATLGVGIGLGDARRAVGLQLSYTLASFGTLGRDLGTGGFNAKLHRQFPNGLSAALGWEGFVTLGDDVDFEDTVYGSVTQLIRTTPNINKPLSRIALTAGVGNGRFRSEDDFNEGVDSFSVFGSAAVRIARPLSVIVEWTGQDLAAGLSITPIRNFPLVITPALRDIAGAGDGARFVIGTGVSFQF